MLHCFCRCDFECFSVGPCDDTRELLLLTSAGNEELNPGVLLFLEELATVELLHMLDLVTAAHSHVFANRLMYVGYGQWFLCASLMRNWADSMPSFDCTVYGKMYDTFSWRQFLGRQSLAGSSCLQSSHVCFYLAAVLLQTLAASICPESLRASCSQALMVLTTLAVAVPSVGFGPAEFARVVSCVVKFMMNLCHAPVSDAVDVIKAIAHVVSCVAKFMMNSRHAPVSDAVGVIKAIAPLFVVYVEVATRHLRDAVNRRVCCVSLLAGDRCLSSVTNVTMMSTLLPFVTILVK